MHPRYKKRLQELCIERDLFYDDIVSKKQDRVTAYHRRHLMVAMSREFPTLSTPRLAELFNKTNHSSIVTARQQAVYEEANGVTEWLRSSLDTPRTVSHSSAKLIRFQGQ